MSNLSELCAKIDYVFKDLDLLITALTHRSYHDQNNERLEFLGDSLLNITISELLFHKFSQYNEGQLTQMRASMVNAVTLAKIAKKIGLGTYLILGPGEIKNYGYKRESILADALEAIFAAIFLDSNLVACQKTITKLYQETVDELHLHKDHKTLLQEYAQKHKFHLPKYEIIQETGAAHSKTFYIRCTLNTKISEGSENTRRKAEQIAAAKLLKLLKTGK
jgi:ribonuclease III